MIPPIQQDILTKLARVCELSEDVRFGQIMAFLGFLAEDMCGRGLWNVEDEELIGVIEKHAEDLIRRKAPVTP
jgi:hypothetical protein